MSNQEKKYLYAVRAQELGRFQPMVDRYEFIRETAGYYFILERGNETRLHKSSSGSSLILMKPKNI